MPRLRYPDSGFTLVELLIVMAIIAVLAVGVMLGLNPLEQQRKARDSNKSKMTGEIGRALYIYYSAHQEYPFNLSPESNPKYVKWDYVDGALSSGISGTSDMLVPELREAFIGRVAADGVYYVGNNDTAEPNACYIPEAKLARETIQKSSTVYQGMNYYILTRSGALAADVTYGMTAAVVGDCAVDDDWIDDGADTTVCVLCLQ